MPDSADEIERRLQANEDPYLDPRWGVLANRVGARTQHELDAVEHDLVEFRTIELSARPVKATFDEKHLRAIHRHLFQDIYSWAGELRTVDTSKPGDRAGFFPHQRFAFGVPATFEQLQERRFRPGMPRAEFVHKLAGTYDEINHLHLFREGNGRTQRIFLTQLARHAGYEIDWARVTGTRNDQVCRAAGHGNVEPMWEMLNDVVNRPPLPGHASPNPLVQESRRTVGPTEQRHRRLPESSRGQNDEMER